MENPSNHYGCDIMKDLKYQTIEFDNCDDYHVFLKKLKQLHDKVESGDLSDFIELNL